MASIRAGNQPVLVIVDAQAGVIAEAWDAARVIKNIARAVERAREQSVPVIWVQHEDDELRRDSPPWQFVPGLAPAEGEARIDKRFESSFEETNLGNELTRVGATHLVLAGASTNWCIRATAYGALDRGYDLTLIKDAHTTKSIELKDGTTIEAAGIVAELNVVMTWLSYPGRKNGTARAEEVDFRISGAAR
jgi:nicotinamidase-related amidase